MRRARSKDFIATLHADLALRELRDAVAPVLSARELGDPEKSVDAAMDHRLPRDASPELLRQAKRCLLEYIGWLLKEARVSHPSWAKDEVQRVVRRLVEVQAAAKGAQPKLH